MSIEEFIIKKAMEPDKVTDKVIETQKYIKITGGGIYWFLIYWVMYSAFAYEIIAVQNKLDYVSVGLLVFFFLGVILTIGVYLHIRFFNRYRNGISQWLNDKDSHYSNEELRLSKELQDKKMKYDLLIDNLKADIRNLYSGRDCQKWTDGMNNVWEEVRKQVVK